MKGAQALCIIVLLIGFSRSPGAGGLVETQPVTLEFQDAPVAVVLQALADYQRLNLVVASGVTGNITLRLAEVPWQSALAVILQMSRLSAERQDNILLVFPQEDVLEQLSLQQAQEKQAQEGQPLQALSQTLSYADVDEVALSLQAQRGILLSARGTLMVDKRNNRLHIRDSAAALAVLKPWLQEMDQPLTQVQLAAYIVTISRDSLRELGVNWGLNGENTAAKPLRINNFSVDLGLERRAVSGSFQLARLSGRLLELELSALEQENQVAIVAAPRLLTAHQQTASIKQGAEIPYEVSSGSSGATSIEFKEAVLGMEVTPKVLSNGKITLKLQITQNTPGRSLKRGSGEVLAIDKQEIKTQVTVADGETVVLGGIFQQQSSSGSDKVPLLGDIPLLGTLFRRETDQQQRRELVIFITPTLVKG